MYKQEIRKLWNNHLKSLGFRKTGLTFARSVGEVVHVSDCFMPYVQSRRSGLQIYVGAFLPNPQVDLRDVSAVNFHLRINALDFLSADPNRVAFWVENSLEDQERKQLIHEAFEYVQDHFWSRIQIESDFWNAARRPFLTGMHFNLHGLQERTDYAECRDLIRSRQGAETNR